MKTKTIQHDDGRIEIERVIDEEVLAQWKEWNPLAYEASIVWLEDYTNLDYVRAIFVNYCTHRRNALTPEGKGRVVGYSRLTADARTNPETGFYTRRVFFLLDGESGRTADGSPPKGTLDPKSIAPSTFGTLFGVATSKPAPRLAQWKSEQKKKLKDKKRQAVKAGTLGVLLPLGGKGDRIVLAKPGVMLGRSISCDVTLPFKTVSAEHCHLTWEPGEASWFVADLESTGGTLVNGERIRPYTPTRIRSGETLTLAGHDYKLTF